MVKRILQQTNDATSTNSQLVIPDNSKLWKSLITDEERAGYEVILL